MTDAGFDVPYLVGELRHGGERAEAAAGRAYRAVFGSAMGRVVLLHHLMECGVGRILGCEGSDIQLRYSTGMMDSAIMLANRAGYDEAALAGSVLTQELNDERNPPDDGFGTVLPGPDDDDLAAGDV